MAKTQLLPVLVVILSSWLNFSLLQEALASEEETDAQNWAQDLRSESTKMSLNHLMEKLGEGKVYGEDLSTEVGDMSKNYELKIFVSSSMPVSLLKNYAKEAADYGGSLVIKGLPGGSFKSLTKLVMDIEGKNGVVGSSIQIDQEAFETYDVSSVPTIILSQDKDCLFEETCRKAFDKIIGNVGLKYALEQFSGSGDLKAVAAEILGK